MRETWDKVWSKRAVFDIDEVIACDSGYGLLKRLLGKLPNETVNILEVGCGSGIYSLALLKELGNSSSTATLVDFSSVALEFARENARKNGVAANFVRSDAFQLPFADGTFDIVWNEGVNEHFVGEVRQVIFNEMARVCKPGGQVIVVVPNSLNLLYRLWKRVFETQGKWEYGLEIPYSVCELHHKMKAAGLKPVRLGGRGTLASFVFLRRLVTGRRNDAGSEVSPAGKGLKALRRIVLKTDKLLGPLGGLTGAEIGVKGVKS